MAAQDKGDERSKGIEVGRENKEGGGIREVRVEKGRIIMREDGKEEGGREEEREVKG